MRVDNGRQDFKPLESFLMYDVSGASLFNEDLGHHDAGDDNEDNHGVVLVDGVDTLEVSIREIDRRETLW